jgi:hypothetical protein
LTFFEGNVQQAEVVKSILDNYEKSTCELVNLGKCCMEIIVWTKFRSRYKGS